MHVHCLGCDVSVVGYLCNDPLGECAIIYWRWGRTLRRAGLALGRRIKAYLVDGTQLAAQVRVAAGKPLELAARSLSHAVPWQHQQFAQAQTVFRGQCGTYLLGEITGQATACGLYSYHQPFLTVLVHCKGHATA